MNSSTFVAYLKSALHNNIENLKSTIESGLATEYQKCVGELNVLKNLFNGLDPFHANCLDSQNSANSPAAPAAPVAQAPSVEAPDLSLSSLVKNVASVIESDVAAIDPASTPAAQ